MIRKRMCMFMMVIHTVKAHHIQYASIEMEMEIETMKPIKDRIKDP